MSRHCTRKKNCASRLKANLRIGSEDVKNRNTTLWDTKQAQFRHEALDIRIALRTWKKWFLDVQFPSVF
jgi:hypothetical protein